MDILSLLFFFIYILIILVILIYVSPIISAVFMLIVPVFSMLILPVQVSTFFSIKQFSFVEDTVPIYNLHILLFVWSAFIAVIAYAEVLTWYLLREKKPKIVKAAEANVPGEITGNTSIVAQIKDFAGKLTKILKGEKPKPKT